jgi:hypothetical protein
MAFDMNHPVNVVRGLVAISVFLIGGCNSDTNSGKEGGSGGGTGVYLSFCDLPAPCQDIAQACHPKDDGSKGPVHDCHTVGHEVGTLEACSAKHTECLKTCGEAPPLSDGPVEDLGAACHDASSTAR